MAISTSNPPAIISGRRCPSVAAIVHSKKFAVDASPKTYQPPGDHLQTIASGGMKLEATSKKNNIITSKC